MFSPKPSTQLRGALLPPLQTENDLVAHLHSSTETNFFVAEEQRERLVGLLSRCCPRARPLVVASADKVCAHTFDLLGSGDVNLGEKIDWHRDFKSGYRWEPHAYYADIEPAPYPGGYDIKVPWELSRCQHFVRLGQAYWITNDENYAHEFVAELEGWIEDNPWPWGVNWACTMDVAIRAVNWLWGYHLLRHSPNLTDEFRLLLYTSLLVHGRHIIRNLEKHGGFTNNHYLSNLVGLVYLGILCPELKEAQHWRQIGLQQLEREVSKQVYPDGVDFEASMSYHRLATELFLSAVILARLNGHTFGRPFMDRLEKMLEFVMYATKPDGTVPLIGDSDNGRLHRLKAWEEPPREWVDCRYLLAIGAVLFGREDFAQAAGDQWEEAIWLWGEKAPALKWETETKGLPPLRLGSRAFPDAGLYVMRHDDLYMIVDAGPNGQNGTGGHAHNDTASFELYARGQTWIVDPGTYVYTADYEARNRFRSTAYHNAVTVDEQEQNRCNPKEPFRMENDARPRALKWAVSENRDVLTVEHEGYRRLPGQVVHLREFVFDKPEGRWLIRDTVKGQGHHRLAWSLHSRASRVRLNHSTALLLSDDGLSGLLVQVDSQTVGGWKVEKSEFAPQYGRKEPMQSIVWHVDQGIPFCLNLDMCPVRFNISEESDLSRG